MKKVQFLMICISSVMIFCGLLMHSIVSKAEDFTFSVDAILPENQIDPNKTFFDLRMTPSQTQELQIRLRNYSDKPITLEVAVNTAYTNNNGLIEYDRTDLENNVDLPFSIHDLAKVQEPEVTLKPKESKTVGIQLTMPEQPFDGMLLGGIYVRPKAEKQTSQEQAGRVKNIQSMVKGLRVSERDNPVVPELRMSKAYASQIGYRNVFLATLENPKPMILTDVKIQASVYKKDQLDKAILTNQSEGFKLAPNSKLEYGVFLNEQLFEPGNYVMKLKVESAEQVWEFSQPLKVTIIEAQKFNDSLEIEKGHNISWVKWLVVALCSFLIILISVVILVKKSGKDKFLVQRKWFSWLFHSDEK